ncbi:RidA family protein [Variovorax boronicumulans]
MKTQSENPNAPTNATLRPVVPAGLATSATYSPGMLVKAGADCLFVSGQVGVDADGNTAEAFSEQADLACKGLLGVVEAAGMGPSNIVKVTTYLTKAEDIPAWRAARAGVLGDLRAASTLIIVSALADPRWRVEVEAVAASGR